jgi:hypothetical protein
MAMGADDGQVRHRAVKRTRQIAGGGIDRKQAVRVQQWHVDLPPFVRLDWQNGLFKRLAN